MPIDAESLRQAKEARGKAPDNRIYGKRRGPKRKPRKRGKNE